MRQGCCSARCTQCCVCRSFELVAAFRKTTQQGLDIPENAHQNIIEIVGNTAGELTNRLHLLTLPQLLVAVAFLRQITGNFGKAEQFTGRFAEVLDYDVRPKGAPILAYPPAFGFAFSGSRRGFEDPLWFASSPICVGVEK